METHRQRVWLAINYQEPARQNLQALTVRFQRIALLNLPLTVRFESPVYVVTLPVTMALVVKRL